MNALPENILRCMSPKDRAPLGKAGVTSAEAQAKFEAKSERQLHKDIIGLMNNRGIYFVHSRMDKRTTNAVGTLDFYLCVKGRFIALECKTMNGKLSPEQEKVIDHLIRNGATVVIVRDLGQVKAVLDEVERHGPAHDFTEAFVSKEFDVEDVCMTCGKTRAEISKEKQ
jgi:hypothetical protein